jgi:ketosteroid isomerase-like protein
MKNFIFLLLAGVYSFSTRSQTTKQQDIAAIKSARNACNNALMRHDINEVSSYWLNEFIVIGGNGGSNFGKDSATARLKRQLDQTPGLTYVRTPQKITISDADTLAFETGKWIGLKTKDKNPKWLGGDYSAMWWKRDGVWKLRSELFVSLKHY